MRNAVSKWEENLKKKYNYWASYSKTNIGFGFKSWTMPKCVGEDWTKRTDLQIYFWRWQINFWWRGDNI